MCGNALRLENVAEFRVQRHVPRGTSKQARNAAAVFGIPAMVTSLCYQLSSVSCVTTGYKSTEKFFEMVT